MNPTKYIISVLFYLLLVANTQAQPSQGVNSKMATDSLRCIRQISVYKEFLKLEAYADAINSYQYVVANCPNFGKYIFMDGEKLVKYRIDNEKDPVLKNNLVDTLLHLYDLRIKQYGQEGFVLGKKGIDLYTYRKKSNADVMQAYQWLRKSTELDSTQSQLSTINHFMITSAALYNAKSINGSQFISDYFYISALTQKMQQSGVDKIELAISNNDKIFNSINLNCNDLWDFARVNYKSDDKNDLFKQQLVNLLDKAQCQNDSVYAIISEDLYASFPSAASAYNLFKYYQKNNNSAKAQEFLNKTIALKSESLKTRADSTDLAQYLVELGNIDLKERRLTDARSNALQSLKYRTDWGVPYIIIANAYANASAGCGTDNFTKKAVYWAAVDKLIEGKNADPSLASEINKLIDTYSAQFPNKEDAFFYNITEGSVYKVNCWIQETTRARF